MGMGFTLVFLLILSQLYPLRSDLQLKLGQPRFVWDLGMLFLSGWTSFFVSCRLSIPGLPTGFWFRFLALVPLGVWSVSLLAKYARTWMEDPQLVFLGSFSFFCLQNFLLFLFIPGTFLLYQLRRLVPINPRWSAGLAVLSTASMGNFALMLLEQNDEIYHQVSWHLLPTLAWIGLGFCCGKKALHW